MEEFAESRGEEASNIEIQLEFLLAELGHPNYDADNYASMQFSSNADKEAWENADTPEEAAEIFSNKWERPAYWDTRRATWAREFYDKYIDLEGDYDLGDDDDDDDDIDADTSDVAEFALAFELKDLDYFIENYPSYFTWSDWCAYFATFCYDQCGLIPSVIKSIDGSCNSIWNANKSKTKLRSSGYIPKSGDLIFFNYSNSGIVHIGIVYACDGTRVYTIEGNKPEQIGGSETFPYTKVRRRDQAIDDSGIYGYIPIDSD